jgi:MYXO-CTERM domain-containing protein
MTRWDRVRPALVLLALCAASVSAVCVPSEDGGLVPAAVLLLVLTARLVRRRTSPESRRA